ncbi:hypothetical protein KFL_004010050 [Klebsormidium nitens]|uniref:Uncharacterized protein n=1 Tax=Klebsormidium nitens TaxID=105231 RepID=A0A1Y1IC06_KLENI|nr:hypothetical protein KFL_004010050 [Klebsormidium nitens]|eukprot:GAQ88113.1 hypothetical protein KFL_004010050 [Klebsormidium nitens]
MGAQTGLEEQFGPSPLGEWRGSTVRSSCRDTRVFKNTVSVVAEINRAIQGGWGESRRCPEADAVGVEARKDEKGDRVVRCAAGRVARKTLPNAISRRREGLGQRDERKSPVRPV